MAERYAAYGLRCPWDKSRPRPQLRIVVDNTRGDKLN
jgi:hypothetical protein